MRVGVILASLGRPDELADVLRDLSEQTQGPAPVILSLEKPSDAPLHMGPEVEVIYGPRGLCAQRNRGLDAIQGRCDVVAFFDDDYVPSRFTIARIAELFETETDVVGATGRVLADGVKRGGISYPSARETVDAYDQAFSPRPASLKTTATAYGCNMAFRMAAIDDLRFDENLPLYGWQEDVDFAGRIRRRGRLVATDAFAGVHRGVTRGRMPGKRFGYSQIANPIYLIRKGSMRRTHALTLLAKNVLANHLGLVRPEPHVDRRGRAAGNWLAFRDLVSGRLTPSAILNLDR